MPKLPSPTNVIGPIVDVIQVLSSGGMTGQPHYASHEKYDCGCGWNTQNLRICTIVHTFAGIIRARLRLVVNFQYDGCNVANARVLISNKSFIGILSGVTFKVQSHGYASRIPCKSGCKDCCEESASVEFDISVTDSGPLSYGTGLRTYKIRVCGNGKGYKLRAP